MKNNYFTMKLVFINFILLILSNNSFSQACAGNQVKVTMENLVVTATAIEYDVYIENTGTTTMLLAAMQGSVIYDQNLLPAGATGTLTVLTQPNQTPSFTTLNTIVQTQHNVPTRQLRWAHLPVVLSSGNTVNLPSNTPMFFARYRFESSIPWSIGSYTLSFWDTVAAGYTITLATVYCNGNLSSTPVSATTGDLLMVNRTFNVTEQTLNTLDVSGDNSVLKMSPNPFNDYFSLSLQSKSNEVVTIKVYDLTGKLIESKTINPIDVTRCEMGSKYASGVYNVVVSQGEIKENHKMIKR